MFDPLMTLLVAKAKAIGLVAGTALATTALVGGGAVAMTAVSSESDVEPDAAVVQQVEGGEATEVVSATPTVGIEEPPPASTTDPVQVDEDADGFDDVSGLPMGFVCDDSKNHGQNVSAYARSLPKGPGRGPLVSAVAKSDCGKTAETEVETAEVEESEATTVKPAKPAKAQKPAKAEKPAKADRPAKAKPAKTERAGKPAGAGKPEGKGQPKG